jgi:hypothetical protein
MDAESGQAGTQPETIAGKIADGIRLQVFQIIVGADRIRDLFLQ